MWCPNFLNSGTCPDQPECPHQHPNFSCDICGLALNTQAQYRAHLTTKRHQKATRAVSRTLSTAPCICKVCGVKLSHPKNIPQHGAGRAHCVRLQDLVSKGVHYTRDEMYPVDEDVVFHCDICDSMEWYGREQHLRTARHKNKVAYLSVRAALDEAEKDKYGISVSAGGQGGVDFGIIDTGIRQELRLTVTSTVPNTQFVLLSVKLSSSHSVNSRARRSSCVVMSSQNGFALDSIRFFTDLLLHTEALSIMYANEKEVLLAFCSSDRGCFQDRVELTFYDPVHTKRFAITRKISAIVGNKEDYEAIKPTAPYTPKHKKVREKVGSVVEGPKPLAIAETVWADEAKALQHREESGTVSQHG
jgi:helicase MOV-10